MVHLMIFLVCIVKTAMKWTYNSLGGMGCMTTSRFCIVKTVSLAKDVPKQLRGLCYPSGSNHIRLSCHCVLWCLVAWSHGLGQRLLLLLQLCGRVRLDTSESTDNDEEAPAPQSLCVETALVTASCPRKYLCSLADPAWPRADAKQPKLDPIVAAFALGRWWSMLWGVCVPEIQIDILAKVLKVRKLLHQSGLGGTDWDFETNS